MKYLILAIFLSLSTTVRAQWVDFSGKQSGDPIVLQDFVNNFNELKNKIVVDLKGSPLVSNAGQILTDGASNILFTEVYDSHNIWNEGGAYLEIPAGKTGIISFSGSIMLNSNMNRFVSLYKGNLIDGLSHEKNCSNRSNAEDIVSFHCKIYVTGGEVLGLRLNNGNGQLSATSNRGVYHHLVIHEE